MKEAVFLLAKKRERHYNLRMRRIVLILEYDGKNYVDTAKDGIAGTPCKGYQQTVKEYTGCKVVTLGYNGGNSAYIASRVKNYDFSNIDYVVLDGGVNDYIVGGVAPGELTPIDKVYSIEKLLQTSNLMLENVAPPCLAAIKAG